VTDRRVYRVVARPSASGYDVQILGLRVSVLARRRSDVERTAADAIELLARRSRREFGIEVVDAE